MPTDNDNNPSVDGESKCKDEVYTLSSYEDTRNGTTKPLSYDPSDYIQKARITRAAPPKPAYDPLQFVQPKPCSLVKTAQEQMKKAQETVKKVKEEKKEEPEEWQCNLDNWKSSRRKRVEHIIDRVVEVKKLELEEHDRNRRKSKTFNEMMEERGGSRRLKYLPIYADSDDNDLSELGIGNSNCPSTAASTTEDACQHDESVKSELDEYTYEGAIESYKSRISKTTHILADNTIKSNKVQTHNSSFNKNDNDCSVVEPSINDENKTASQPKSAKIYFLKRKEIFENDQIGSSAENESKRQSAEIISTVSIKERLSVLQLNGTQAPNEVDKKQKTLPDISFTDLKNRLEVFEREIKTAIDEKVCITKSSQSAFTSHESSVEPPDVAHHNVLSIVKAIDTTNLEDRVSNNEHHVNNAQGDFLKQIQTNDLDENENLDTDREDSGIHTTDVSCSVSQADDQTEDVENPLEDDPNSNTHDLFFNDIKSQTTEIVSSDKLDGPECDETNDVSVLDDALEMAFQEIDNVQPTVEQTNLLSRQEPIYQNIDNEALFNTAENVTNDEIEPYYQVPKSLEPYYEVPKTKPVPLYENVDVLQTIAGNSNTISFAIGINKLQPPKEKPPPPPVDDNYIVAEQNKLSTESSIDNFKRINSTKRIREEISSKRSNFLGINSVSTEDKIKGMATPGTSSFVLEERKLEKQFLAKIVLYDTSDAAESRDSGVSENHSRQSSDLFTTSSDDPEDIFKPKLSDGRQFNFNEYRDQQYRNDSFQQDEDAASGTDYDNDQVMGLKKSIPLSMPPAKPMRSPQYLLNHHSLYSEHRKSLSNVSSLDYGSLPNKSLSENQIAYHNACQDISPLTEDFLLGSDQTLFCNNSHVVNSQFQLQDHIPLLKPVSDRDHHQVSSSYQSNEYVSEINSLHSHLLRQRSYTECTPQWTVRSTRQTQRSNRHWFIQEAEQRRIEQEQQQKPANSDHSPNSNQTKTASRKSLPESVIQTITQRVQKLGIGTDRRWHSERPYQPRKGAKDGGAKPTTGGSQILHQSTESDERVLSVSGKKKCSHCSNELGRGAAMVIESLGLLYHIDCFKCCVCHIRLGDGLKGTDVRVRKYKLHCQNCFSSEDGVKFSCV